MSPRRAAARALTGCAPPDAEAAELLQRLGYDDGAEAKAPHRAVLLRIADSLADFAELRSPDAPGLTVLAATLSDGTSVAGAGPTFAAAFESCVGEAVETLSQIPRAQGDIVRMPPAEALADSTQSARAWEDLQPYRRDRARADADWVCAADLADGRLLWMPADLCVRRPDEMREADPPWPLSTGCAAAEDRATAALHALLELIERDAAALWWRAGRRAHLLAPDSDAQARAGALLAQLRGAATGRRSWLLDITSDLAVPTVAAVSCRADGRGFCCGLAARLTLADAACRAVIELAQMELGLHLAEAARETRGETALDAAQRRHLRRGERLAADEIPALHPLAPPRAPCDIAAPGAVAALGAIRARLAAHDLFPCAIDLTREAFQIPVVRVICPGLQPDPSAPATSRLREAMAAAGVAAETGVELALL
jgi:ribosomal protein S12 methylthiotransferase accessory factor